MAADPVHDPVNRPAHYTSLGALCPGCARPIECIDVSEHFPGNLAQVIQYVWRCDHKGGIEDLRKAVWFLEREITRRARGGVKS